MPKIFSFKKQYDKGLKGEDYFCKCYHSLNPVKSSIREVDVFIDKNKKVEIKSDSYSEDDTPNIFIELIGNTKTGKLGGPFLSKSNSVDWFVYHYTKDKTFYWFDVNELCDFVDKNAHKYKQKEIRNVAWSSIGICIPREDLKNITKRFDKFND